MSFRLKFKPNIGSSKDRRNSGITPNTSTAASTERGSGCPVSVSELLTKDGCRLTVSPAETLTPGTCMLQCGDDYMDPNAGEVVGSLVTISNGESDLENIMAKRASAARGCLNDDVSLDDAYPLDAAPLPGGGVSLEDDAIRLSDAMSVPLDDEMPLDDSIPLDNDDVIPLEAAALLGGPQDIADADPSADTRQPSPTVSPCTPSSGGNCVTPVEGSSPHGREEEPRDQSSEAKPQAKKRTRKSNGSSGAKRRKKDDETSSVVGGTKKSKVREAPDRATMTMQELIYYNPTANPMSRTGEEEQKQEDEVVTALETPVAQDKDKSVAENHSSMDAEDQEDEDDQGRLVPKLKIGADGNIIIDEASMFVESSRKAPTAIERELIREYSGNTTSSSFRKTYKITRWTKDETNLFFRALSQVGTDFTMMTLLLPKRTRKELKNKFKKEEKLRPHLVSDALKTQISH